MAVNNAPVCGINGQDKELGAFSVILVASAIYGDAIKSNVLWVRSFCRIDQAQCTEEAKPEHEAAAAVLRRALLPHIARAEVAALIFQWRTNPHLKYHLFRSSGVKLVLKCRDNYSEDGRNTQKNVPEVVKESVCARARAMSTNSPQSAPVWRMFRDENYCCNASRAFLTLKVCR